MPSPSSMSYYYTIDELRAFYFLFSSLPLAGGGLVIYSHSMVAGGLEVMS